MDPSLLARAGQVPRESHLEPHAPLSPFQGMQLGEDLPIISRVYMLEPSIRALQLWQVPSDGLPRGGDL